LARVSLTFANCPKSPRAASAAAEKPAYIAIAAAV